MDFFRCVSDGFEETGERHAHLLQLVQIRAVVKRRGAQQMLQGNRLDQQLKLEPFFKKPDHTNNCTGASIDECLLKLEHFFK
jgi:hypothetical protein